MHTDKNRSESVSICVNLWLKNGSAALGRDRKRKGPSTRPSTGSGLAQGTADLNRQWKTLKRGPLPAQVTFLSRGDVITAFGEKRVADLLLNLGRRIEQLTKSIALSAPSETWMADAIVDGVKFPPPLDRNAMSLAELRRDTAMVLSRARLRYGDGLARQRWTPTIAVSGEDRLDLNGADDIRDASCSALAILRIRLIGAHESKGRRKRGQRALIPYYYPVGGERVQMGYA